MVNFSISIFNQAKDRTPKQMEATWPQLYDALTTYREPPSEKPLMKAWSATRYEPGSARGASNVLELTCLVLDYDCGVEIDTAKRVWYEYPHCGHTSWSHTPDHHKFRIVVPLARPVPAELWPAVWAWANEKTDGKIDQSCKDPSRIWFLPARFKGKERISWIYDGTLVKPFLDFDHEELAKGLQRKDAWKEARRKCRAARALRVGDTESAVQARLKADPSSRLNVGLALGGSQVGEQVRHIRCPDCEKRSVWFVVAPERSHWAKCNHVNSCGWWGSLFDLAKKAGLR